MAEVLYSEVTPPFDWSEASSNKMHFGPKGALLAVLPRAWTLPFALVPWDILSDADAPLPDDPNFFERVRALAHEGSLIVRSSVIHESIWDRGKYASVVIEAHAEGFAQRLSRAAGEVIESAQGKRTALVIQRFLSPRRRGEFGNLLRISKTRDQWELSIEDAEGPASRIRFNTQRDEAASVQYGLFLRARQPVPRLFGSIASWFNSYLLRGRADRLNCEWIGDDAKFYIVQVDQEDEDFSGINPFQLTVSAAHAPLAARGKFFVHALDDVDAIKTWDKLKVLEQLWEPDAPHKPMLFFAPLTGIPSTQDETGLTRLEDDFRSLIGEDDIVVRTSVRVGDNREFNLPRTESISPAAAAKWCAMTRDTLLASGQQSGQLAFVAHRFIGARASAWARVDPKSPIVEIHSLWGLPDALQFCPYDIWEVHVPTDVATEYPDYKSNILIPQKNGGWEHARVKNELARSLSIGSREAIEIAKRSLTIAHRLNLPCHIMWFVGCVDDIGERFNIPWYWAEAHDAGRNVDRSNYRTTTVSDRETLKAFSSRQHGPREAIAFMPTSQALMRDNKFIAEVGRMAKEAGVPVILAGSTLAHAYYILRREGCTVVPTGEKDHSRVRRTANFGKLVRDKIPTRIADRQEAEATLTVPEQTLKRFLTSKLIEEALEVRNAEGREMKTVELADLLEVVKALAAIEKIPMEEVVARAEKKRESAGGFEKGLVLLQTGILGRDRVDASDLEKPPAQVLARRLSSTAYEIPFSFFGFMEMDQPRSLIFDELGVRLDVILRNDRIELQLSREPRQLEMLLDAPAIDVNGDT